MKKSWQGELLEKLKRLCKSVNNFEELKKQALSVFPDFTPATIEMTARRYPEFIKHFKSRWEKDREVIQNCCKKAYNWNELQKLIAQESVLAKKVWSNVKRIILNNPEWTEHFSQEISAGEKDNSPESKHVQTGFLTEAEEKLINLIRKPVMLSKLCDELDMSSNDIYQLVDSLRNKGYEATIEKKVNDETGEVSYEAKIDREAVSGGTLKLKGVSRREFKILVLSDTAYGLKSHQPELLATALEAAKKQRVDFAIHAGNIVAGRTTPTTEMDFLDDDFFSQVRYAGKMPNVPFKMYFLNGPKDLRHKRKVGQNVARALCEGINNFRYAGDLEANFIVGGLRIKVLHVKDVVTYTKSYTLQGLRENLQESITYHFRKKRKPDILLVGGTLTYIHLPAKKTGGVEAIGLPSLYAMTASQKARKKRGGSPELGYVILTVKLGKDGKPTNIDHEWYPLTAYQRSEAIVDFPEVNNDNGKALFTKEQKGILDILKERPYRYGELSRIFRKSKKHIQRVIKELKKIGYDIPYDRSAGTIALIHDWTSRKFNPIRFDGMFEKTLKVSCISDTHIGNREALVGLITRAYSRAKQEGVDVMTHSGDLLDGTGAYYGHEMEIIEHGADDQLDRADEVWPDSKIPTKIISGSSHEWVYWLKSGHNVVKSFAKLRDNVEYIGGRVGIEGTRTINGVMLKLVHPKGGVPYGKTYRLQNYTEGMVEEIEDSTDGVRLLLIGHLHIAIAMIYKGIAAFLIPCLEEQTWYLKSKGLNPWIGMWIIEITLDTYNNITRLRPKYISFENGEVSEDK